MNGWLQVSFHARAVQARNAYAIYGLPGPGAWLGFAHALSCRMPDPFPAKDVIFVVNDYRFERDTDWSPFRFRRSTEIAVEGKTIVDRPEMRLQASVFINIGDRHVPNMADVRSALSGMRFAGGVMDQAKTEIQVGMLEDLWSRQPRGYVVLAEPLPAEGTPMDAMVQALTGVTSGWVRPSLRGYELLTEPSLERSGRFVPGTQDRVPVVLAEPLLGLVKYQSVRSPIQQRPAAWHYEHRPQLILFEASPVFI